MRILEIVLALFLPPVAVLIRKGPNAQVLVALLLTLLGHIPGVIYALYVTTQ